jgi:hypothetical protein
MPQLDKFTFLDQSLTVIIFFSLMYFLSLYFFLPRILFIIRFRNRLFTFLKEINSHLTRYLTHYSYIYPHILKRNYSILNSVVVFLFIKKKDFMKLMRIFRGF